MSFITEALMYVGLSIILTAILFCFIILLANGRGKPDFSPIQYFAIVGVIMVIPTILCLNFGDISTDTIEDEIYYNNGMYYENSRSAYKYVKVKDENGNLVTKDLYDPEIKYDKIPHYVEQTVSHKFFIFQTDKTKSVLYIPEEVSVYE